MMSSGGATFEDVLEALVDVLQDCLIALNAHTWGGLSEEDAAETAAKVEHVLERPELVPVLQALEDKAFSHGEP